MTVVSTYGIVYAATPEQLANEVQGYMEQRREDGQLWQPLGGIACMTSQDNDSVFVQAIGLTDYSQENMVVADVAAILHNQNSG